MLRIVKVAFGRTGWAALLTALAIGAPCAAWYVAGARAAEQEAERLAETPRAEAQAEAERIARALAVRLEALRFSETRRSFADYGPHILHDTPAPCDCALRLPSPLSHGPADPLVWAHFQIDEVGQLTLPSLAGEPPASHDDARRALSDERAILEVLECAAGGAPSGLPAPPAAEAGERVAAADGGMVLTVGPFEWHRVSLEDKPALVALRQVLTAQAALTQGFVIRKETLEALLGDARYPARLVAGEAGAETAARIPIGGEPWSVVLDPAGALADASGRAAEVRSRFARRFAVGLLGAVACWGLVVGLVGQAERLARQRARFAAAAAHELRTPLAGLRLYGEMVGDESGDPAQRRRYALRIAGEAERLGRVVTNLLGFSKLERGELRLRTTSGDLGAAVRDSVARLRPALEADGAVVEMSLSASLPPVCFDPDALHQVLQNLLDNAARYGRSARDPTIRVAVEPGPGGPVLSVSDHGPGVDPALRGRMFRPFVRHAAAHGHDGLGLGLPLVHALARAQGAQVSYADADGGGARFVVSFPAAADDRWLRS